MREILFRAKLLFNKKWVYGSFVREFDGSPQIISDDDGGMYEIIPETLSQYTGLTDKNGRKIFEGDIVQYSTNTNRSTNKEFHEVVFETRGGSGYFGIKISNVETWQFCLEVPAKLMEVIGNIYDNPELMKGADK